RLGGKANFDYVADTTDVVRMAYYSTPTLLTPAPSEGLPMIRIRKLAAASVAAIFAVAGAACGSDDDGSSPASTGAAAPTDAPGATGAPSATAAPTTDAPTTDAPNATDAPSSSATFPLTIEHALGTTVIESKPERIATVQWANHEVPLA